MTSVASKRHGGSVLLKHGWHNVEQIAGNREDFETMSKAILAPTFNIRTEVTDEDHAMLLKYSKHTLPVWEELQNQKKDADSDATSDSHSDADGEGSHQHHKKGCLPRRYRCSRRCIRTSVWRCEKYFLSLLPIQLLATKSVSWRWILKLLSSFSVVIAPLQLSLEPGCDDGEGMLSLLVAHFVGSVAYIGISVGGRWVERTAKHQRSDLSQVPAGAALPPPRVPARRESLAAALASSQMNQSRLGSRRSAESSYAAAYFPTPQASQGPTSQSPEASQSQDGQEGVAAIESESSASEEEPQPKFHRLSNREWWERLGVVLDNLALIGTTCEIIHLFQTKPVGLPSWEQLPWCFVLLRTWRLLEPPLGTELNSWTFFSEVLKLLGVLVVVAHLGACWWVLTAVVEQHYLPALKTWTDPFVNPDPLADKQVYGCEDIYMSALYFCSYTLTGVGYGDIVPKNGLEQAVSVVYMMVGQICVAKIFANLNWLTATHSFWQARHYERVTQVMVALDSLGVPQVTRSRALAYLDYVNEEQKQRRAQECIKDLSMPLREELNIIVYNGLVLAAPFLNSQSVPVIRSIIMCLSDAVYLPCDMIIRRGDEGQELFFIRDGRVDIFVGVSPPTWTDEPVCIFAQGHYFGEVAILTGQKRSSWVMARTFCVCAVLTKAAVEEVMNAFPNSVATLVGSLRETCKITPAVPLEEVSARIVHFFSNDEKEMDSWVLSRSQKNITWQCYQELLSHVGISSLDQKLHWSHIDSDGQGYIALEKFIQLMKNHGAVFEPTNGHHYHESPVKTRVSDGDDRAFTPESNKFRRPSQEQSTDRPPSASTDRSDNRNVQTPLPGMVDDPAGRMLQVPTQRQMRVTSVDMTAQMQSMKDEVSKMSAQLDALVSMLPRLAATSTSDNVEEC